MSSSAPMTRYAYDGLNAIALYDSSNALVGRTVFDPTTGEQVGSVNPAGTPGYTAHDERGSVIANLNSTGQALFIDSYDEYGKPGSANNGRYGFTGQLWIPDGGLRLNYYKSRFYEPQLGRFLQPDPIGYADSPNVYDYVGDDPVNLIDPSGLTAASDDIVITGSLPFYFGSGGGSLVLGAGGGGGGRGTSGPSCPGCIIVTGTRPHYPETFDDALDPLTSEDSNDIIITGTRLYLAAQPKGERGRTARPSGTLNPDKKYKPAPTPGKRIFTDPHTGKKTIKPWPDDPRLGGTTKFGAAPFIIIGGIIIILLLPESAPVIGPPLLV